MVLPKSYENSKTIDGRMTLLFEKVKKHGDFCVHAFVKYANNLYTLRILGLKNAITYYSGTIPGYL